MYVVRPVRETDLNALERFAFSTALGMLSLPRNRGKLMEKIDHSIASFLSPVSAPGNETYLFILENLQNGEPVGSCGIYAKTGVVEPLYFYRIETERPKRSKLPLPDEILLLHPYVLYNGPTEIGALFVEKKWRKEGLGELLSLCRFLFIASFPERFEQKILARLRGFINRARGTSPFWEGLGKHFLSVDFQETQSLQAEGSSFIPQFLPKYPIYTNLLPKQTQYVIGKTHPTTRPAEKMLRKEGFKSTPYIDLFDAGPIVEAPVETVRTIKESRVFAVKEITTTPLTSRLYLVSNDRLDFRCCYAQVEEMNVHDVTLSKNTAEMLQVNLGDRIRLGTPHS